MGTASIIESNGGAAHIAAVLKEKPGTVRVWKNRGRIPPRAWPDFIAAFPGVSLDDLKGAYGR